VVLACYVVARLAADRLGAGLPPEGRAARAAGAKAWLGTLALPAAVRGSLAHCAQASGDAEPAAVGESLATLVQAAESYLDTQSRAELEGLAERLRT
jgi:hypothetical protein